MATMLGHTDNDRSGRQAVHSADTVVMIKRNRQRNTPYVMPIRQDVTRQYMKTASPRNFYGWSIRNGHKY